MSLGIVSWSVAELYNSLYDEDWVPQAFLKQIVEHQIDGATLLELSKDDLREEFGMTKLGDIKTLLRHIKYFHHKHGGTINGTSLNSSLGASMTGSTPAALSALNDSAVSLGDVNLSGTYNSSFMDSPGVNAKKTAPDRFQEATAAQLNKPPARQALDEAFESAVLGDGRGQDFPIDGLAASTPEPSGTQQGTLPPLRPATHLGFVRDDERPSSSSSSSSKKKGAFHSADTATLKAGSLDIELAKKTGRPKRARERRERQEQEEQGLQGSPFQPGLLEVERRRTAIQKIFTAWTGGEETAVVSGAQVRGVLQAFQHAENGAEGNSDEHTTDLVSGEVVTCMRLQHFMDFMDSATFYLPPAIFDDLVQYFYVALGDVEKKSEHARRFAMWQDLFRVWDVSDEGSISIHDLALVLELFNQRAEEDSEDWIVFKYDNEKISTDLPEDSEHNKPLAVEPFINLMMDLCTRWGKEDFDVMYYKITGCVHSLEEQLGQHNKSDGIQPDGTRKTNDSAYSRVSKFVAKGRKERVTVEYLQGLHDTQPPTRPFVFFGRAFDPTKTVETLATMNGIFFKGLVVASSRSEESALKKVKYNGISKGAWILLVVAAGYDNIDNFLRHISVLLQTTSSWMVHKNFRLWMLVPFEYLMDFPNVLLMKSVPIPLDAKEGLTKRAECYMRPNSPHLPFHRKNRPVSVGKG